MKIIITLFLCLSFYSSFSQWSKIHKKTKFVYTSYSMKLKYNEDKNKYDTIWKKREPNFEVTVDTVIKLSGDNRKLIFFPNCIDTLFVGRKQIIVYGKIENLPRDKHGIIDYSQFSKGKEKFKSSIIYQIGTETYILTVSKNIYARVLNNQQSLIDFDLALSHLNTCSDCMISVITDNYIHFENISLPFHPFFELNQSIKYNERSDPLMFEPGEGFFFYDSSINCSCYKNKLFGQKIDCYSPTDSWTEKRSICLDNDLGIVGFYYRSNSDDNPKIAYGSVYSLVKVQ